MAEKTKLEMLNEADRARVELIALFRRYGYDGYKMAKFESYEVYLKNKDYIGSESIITFTDSAGRLMALRPDVTLSIINNLSEGEKKYYYDENVFRRDGKGDYREIRQIGIENIGGDGEYSEYEVVSLAVKALKIMGVPYALCVGDMDVVEELLSPLVLLREDREKALGFIRAKAFHELKKLLASSGCDSINADKLVKLVSLEGDGASVIERAEAICGNKVKALGELKKLFTALSNSGLADGVKIDFSVLGDYSYYGGINFRGYLKGIASAVISGGRYDNMARRLGKNTRALGFALDFDALMPLFSVQAKKKITVVKGNASADKIARIVEKYSLEGYAVSVVTENGEGECVFAEEVDCD